MTDIYIPKYGKMLRVEDCIDECDNCDYVDFYLEHMDHATLSVEYTDNGEWIFSISPITFEKFTIIEDYDDELYYHDAIVFCLDDIGNSND